jgi:hypothetical protein
MIRYYTAFLKLFVAKMLEYMGLVHTYMVYSVTECKFCVLSVGNMYIL